MSGFHGFRSLELGKERLILEMVVKAIGLHSRMLDKEKMRLCSYRLNSVNRVS